MATSSGPVKASTLSGSPSSFDWRAYNRVTSVKNYDRTKFNHAYLAFAATAQYESMLAIATKGTLYDLAEHYVLQCYTGSYSWDSLGFIAPTGVPLESSYPYNDKYGFQYPGLCTNTSGRVKIN